MNSMGKAGLSLFFLALFLVVSTFGVSKYYEIWSRRITYPIESRVSVYPGEGRVTQLFGNRIFVNPLSAGKLYSDEGIPFFDDAEKISKYPTDRYEIYTIPAQEELLYAIGKFEAWENIKDSPDKYLVIQLTPTQERERWRVAFEPSTLFGDNSTALAIETTALWPSNGVNVIEKTEPAVLSEIGFETIKNIMKKGDTVVLLPVFHPPILVKKDEQNHSLAGWIVVRRAGGLESFNKERAAQEISKK